MVATMVPPARVLPDVLPTERLTASGRPVPRLRSELRRIPGGRNAVTVIGAWAQSFGVVALAAYIDRWWAYAVAFLLMGRAFALLNILGHEAAHRLLFARRRINDFVGRWLLSYPAFTPFDLYRRVHMAHHKDEMGPEEPDVGLYSGYPISPESMRRKLIRDASGISGWKNLRPLLKATLNRSSRRLAVRILGIQIVIWAAFWVASGRWWLYPLLWLAPWMTVWRVLNRLRAIAELDGPVQHRMAPRPPRRQRDPLAAAPDVAPRTGGGRLDHSGARVSELPGPVARPGFRIGPLAPPASRGGAGAGPLPSHQLAQLDLVAVISATQAGPRPAAG
jgi:hypothetical protein